MDLDQVNTEIHIRIQRQLALPQRWDACDGTKAKVTINGAFKDFIGDTLAFELSPSQKALFQPVLKLLSQHPELFVPRSNESLHMTLRGLANPYTVGISDRSLIQQHIAMNQKRIPEFFDSVQRDLKAEAIDLSDGTFTLSPTRTSGCYYFRWGNSASWKTMKTLQRLCDMADPYKKTGSDIYLPHVTLCYLLPRPYTTQETITIRSVVTDCHQMLNSIKLHFDTGAIRYYYHANMNEYRLIR